MANETNQNKTLEVQYIIKNIVADLKFKPAEQRDYAVRIAIPERKKTKEEFEIEEIAKKYNL